MARHGNMQVKRESLKGFGISFSSHFKNSINGELKSTLKCRTGINPATEQENPDVPVSTPEDVESAMSAADAAFRSWSQLPWTARRDAIARFADALETLTDDFARLLTMEQGKPLRFARDEIQASVLWLRSLSAMTLDEETVSEDSEKKTVVRHVPMGVVVAIVPWNFPMHLACGKIAPALVTGNTIILKPSPYTPYCNLKLGELGQLFFPAGVLQVLSGGEELGPWLVNHPLPTKISFTGSTSTGKAVMAAAARTLKRVTLELGGNDAAIVCADVDIERVAEKVATLALFNSGQVCVAIKRVYVHETIYERFQDAMSKFIKHVKVGEGSDERVLLGPLQNRMQYDKVKALLLDCSADHEYRLVQPEYSIPSTGYFIRPTLVDNPPDSARVVVDEAFGPIFPLLKWSEEADVVRRVNDTKMGLGASVWSNDLDRASRLARRLEAGSVWINTHQEGDPHAPFGGFKESGVGSEWGKEGLKSYCNMQSLFLKKSKENGI